jgi:hypothetical protein
MPWALAGINLHLRFLEEFFLLERCILVGNDLIIVALKDKRRDIDGLEVFRLVWSQRTP